MSGKIICQISEIDRKIKINNSKLNSMTKNLYYCKTIKYKKYQYIDI